MEKLEEQKNITISKNPENFKNKIKIQKRTGTNSKKRKFPNMNIFLNSTNFKNNGKIQKNGKKP